MKLPARWNNGNAKNPAVWSRIAKAAVAWSGSTKTNVTSPAQAWSSVNTKVADKWSSGKWTYNSFLKYNSVVTYNGAPDPINTKAPAQWSNV